jgi:hypothetical protein
MKKPDPFVAWAFAAVALFFSIVVIHLCFVALPVLFLALGFISYAWSGRKALLLFLFLLPLASSTPDLFFNGYPFNYLGIPLFHLAGIFCASRLKKERPPTAFPGRRSYLLFLALLGISVLFVFLRWSNLGLSALAFLRDTPVAPSLERLSFACIFPAVTLALFSLAPWVAFLLRQQRLQEADVFVPLKTGFFLSVLLALAQKWIAPDLLAQAWWGTQMRQVNGGFSDFNAFGFFAGAMFLHQAAQLIERLPHKEESVAGGSAAPAGRSFPGGGLALDLMFLAVALVGIFISGCRTAFLFVLAALLRLLLSRRPGRRIKVTAVVLLAVLLLIAGGTLGKRLQLTATRIARLAPSANLYHAVDKISNGRLEMVRDSTRMLARFPASGVGAGNFLFYLKYLHFGEYTWIDLPLNQYLLVFSETGLAGGLAFILFLAALFWRQRAGRARSMLAVMALALLFNNFFWFPEVLLLFWIFVAQEDWPASPALKKPGIWFAVVLLGFVAMNMVDLQALHPRNWAHEKGTPYDYGFFYPERDKGREFRWSGEKAGIYIHFGKNDPKAECRLRCGAPLALLPGKRQTVDVYWRGRPYRQVIFRENGEYILRIEDKDHAEGFLEFRVRPAFNLERLGLGPERRDLGVQVFAPGS